MLAWTARDGPSRDRWRGRGAAPRGLSQSNREQPAIESAPVPWPALSAPCRVRLAALRSVYYPHANCNTHVLQATLPLASCLEKSRCRLLRRSLPGELGGLTLPALGEFAEPRLVVCERGHGRSPFGRLVRL